MPTHSEDPRFKRDFARLEVESRTAFRSALALFVQDLRAGSFSPRLRVKRVVGHPGVWEMSWAADGRATFQFGPEVLPGEPHIIWRRIGTHDIFRQP